MALAFLSLPPARRGGRLRACQSPLREVVALIAQARQRANQAVSTELVGLYWGIERYISAKREAAVWGEGVVDRLAAYFARTLPGQREVARRSLFRSNSPTMACAVKRRRFPVGVSPTRQMLQPEATGAGMEVTKCLKPSDSGSQITVTARVCRP